MCRLSIVFFLFVFSLPAFSQQYSKAPLSKVLSDIEKRANGEIIINFSPGEIKAFRSTCEISGLSPVDAIRRAIGLYPIKITMRGKYITLQTFKNQAYGHLVDESGNAIGYATVTCKSLADPKFIVHTVSDEKGFWRTNLPVVGKYVLIASYIGYKSVNDTIKSGLARTIVMETSVTNLSSVQVNDTLITHLAEVVVNGEASRNLSSPQIGATTLSAEQLQTIPSMMGEPDVIKALQRQAGVSSGVEGFAGLYVHGGENDQNQFLYEGLPLYHVSHLGGLFSGFNVSTIRKVDFYKAAFPAAYGGHVSSITNINTNAPDFQECHGRLSLGIISGNAYVSKPLHKDKTAIAVGLRHTWLDAISRPALFIMNNSKKANGQKDIASYAFTDFNLRLDHKFGNRTLGKIIGYYGQDCFTLGKRDFQTSDSQTKYFDESGNSLSWGNFGVIASLSHVTAQAAFSAEAYSTNYSSNYAQNHSWQTDMDKPTTAGYNDYETKNKINDLGTRLTVDSHICNFWRLQTGVSFVHHLYIPEEITNNTKDEKDEKHITNPVKALSANEFSAYLDNLITAGKYLELSLGARYTNYHSQCQTHNSLEPRASARLMIEKNLSVKVAYASMAQFSQQIANNYITLPTDRWQPTAMYFKPLRSGQFSAGLYGNLPGRMFFSIEGWYKKMHNLMEYYEGVSSVNPTLEWQQKITSGRGWAYGADISLTRHSGRLTGTANYSLIWNWREFNEINRGEKFPAKFDNRHKINIFAAYKLTKTIDINASWIYATGNRMTMSLYNYQPDTSQFPWAPGWGNHPANAYQEGGTIISEGVDYFSGVNNVQLPAYHRLDLGINFHKRLSKDRRRIWNISLYNAYSRMNPVTIKKDTHAEQGIPTFRTLSFLPIIPSATYTYIF